jgi:hypothetical protein
MLPIVRTDLFVVDVEKQIRWYLDETGLEEIFAAELARRFAAAVEAPTVPRFKARRLARRLRLDRSAVLQPSLDIGRRAEIQ